MSPSPKMGKRSHPPICAFHPDHRSKASSSSPASTYLAGTSTSGGKAPRAYLTATKSSPTKTAARKSENSAAAPPPDRRCRPSRGYRLPFMPSMSTSTTSGRANSGGGYSPRSSISRSRTSDIKTWDEGSWGHVLEETMP